MTRPIDAGDALRKAVDAQRVQREAIRQAARDIADKRETQAATEEETERVP